MSESNYECVRDKIGLSEWSDERQEIVHRDPTNAEILRLLDALHADIQGVEGEELAAARHDRWWNS